MTKKVFMTGLNSFTGAHIARSLVDDGWEVLASMTRSSDEYRDAAASERIGHSGVENFVYDSPFGSESMVGALKDFGATAFVNHGADIKGYRNPDFKALVSTQKSLLNLPKVVEAFEAKGGKSWLHSGSIFELGRGLHPPDSEFQAFSPYGLSKTMTWEGLRFALSKSSIVLKKIVIANPIGPFENLDRLAPFLARKWLAGEAAEVFNYNQVWDFVPASWLGNAYARLLAKDPVGAKIQIHSPSALKMSIENFVRELAGHLKKEKAFSNKAMVVKRGKLGPELKRCNDEKLLEMESGAQLDKFWRSYCSWLAKTSY